MKDHVVNIQEDLDRIDSLLEKEFLFSLTATEKQGLREQSKALREKFSRIEGRYLTVGLLGGTGVGKSSFLNALAGAQIASSSHRRPHTERVLIYRHTRATPLPRAELDKIPWQEVTHQADPMKALLLCDLPDFDSILPEHRARVIAFLTHLDLLVWVTSPEKYADASFYAFLEGVPKARQYFTFVLNKADLLLEGREGSGSSNGIAPVLKGLRHHLGKQGMEDPLIFVLSAEEAMKSEEPTAWNQFPFFRRHLLEQRHIKTITAIKAANLEAEVHQLLTPLERERAHLECVRGILQETLSLVREKGPEWERLGRQAVESWLMGKQYHQATALTGQDLSPLVGPGYALGLVLKTVKGGAGGTEQAPGQPSLFPPKETARALRRPFQWIQERLHQRFLRENLPQTLWEETRDRINLEEEFQGLGEDLSHTAQVFAGQQERPALWGFRLKQYLVYGLLTLCPVAALMGEGAWQGFFDNPSPKALFGLLVAGIGALFGPRGLASLLTYTILCLFLSIRFYRGYTRELRAVARRRRLMLAEALTAHWSEHLEKIAWGLGSLEKEAQERLNALAALWKGSEGT
jgi:hypothetical protein